MTTLASTETQLLERIDEIGAKIHDVREATAATIFGQERVIDLALITLLSGGHALLIGVPGLAKTSLVETLGTVLGLQNKRIQFTPDLMPSDIVGSEVLEEGTGGTAQLPLRQGSGLHPALDGRRDQPCEPKDAVGAVAGHAGASRDRGRRAP